MAGQGSVAYMFERKGEIKVREQVTGDREQEMLELIDLGAEDVEDYDEDEIRKYLVYTEGSELNTMSNKITQAGFGVESHELMFKPNILVSIKDPETAKKVLEFAEKLEESDDVQKVYANFDIPEELLLK